VDQKETVQTTTIAKKIYKVFSKMRIFWVPNISNKLEMSCKRMERKNQVS